MEIRLKCSAGMSVGTSSVGTVAVRRCKEIVATKGQAEAVLCFGCFKLEILEKIC